MAGLLVTFLIEILSHRAFGKRNTIGSATSSAGDDKAAASSGINIVTVEKAHTRTLTINTAVIEAGIIFHSICEFFPTETIIDVLLICPQYSVLSLL
jgi:hypothetical protein